MILLAFIALALVLSLIRGGRFQQLGRLQFRAWYLVLLALGTQLVIFSHWWQRVGSQLWASVLYLLSYLLLSAVVWLNRSIPGILALGAGLILNALVIGANGGRMPASLSALRTAGIVGPDETFETLRQANSTLIDFSTPLWFLGDIFAVPSKIPLANVFSVGDVLIAGGGAWFMVANTRVHENI